MPVAGAATQASSAVGVDRQRALGPLVAITGTAVAIPSAYLALLSMAALWPGSPSPQTRRNDEFRIVVIVPAHNEAELIGRCLLSLQHQDYPQHLTRIVVVADNCSDSTADLAADMGADVLIRQCDANTRGKGRALRWAMDRILSDGTDLDAFAIVDADSIAHESLLSQLRVSVRGAVDAVQAEYLALAEDTGERALLRQAAFLLFHRVRFSGRARLGLPCTLVGNGMLLTRELVELIPWDAYTGAEDLEYSVTLRMRGVRPRFAADARIWAPVASAGAAARTQRLRWEGGRLHIVRTRLPTLLMECVLRRRWDLWDAALDLAVPPLGILTVIAGAGGTLGAILRVRDLIGTRDLLPSLVALVGMPAHVLVGLRAGGAPADTFLALAHAPKLLIEEVETRLRLVKRTGAASWERTARPGEQRRQP
jgi:1,2-diacylglycerol 3-beta-glucosyltransferase